MDGTNRARDPPPGRLGAHYGTHAAGDGRFFGPRVGLMVWAGWADWADWADWPIGRRDREVHPLPCWYARDEVLYGTLVN